MKKTFKANEGTLRVSINDTNTLATIKNKINDEILMSLECSDNSGVYYRNMQVHVVNDNVVKSINGNTTLVIDTLSNRTIDKAFINIILNGTEYVLKYNRAKGGVKITNKYLKEYLISNQKELMKEFLPGLTYTETFSKRGVN